MNTQNHICESQSSFESAHAWPRVRRRRALLLTIGATQVKPAVAGIRPGAARTFETAGLRLSRRHAHTNPIQTCELKPESTLEQLFLMLERI